MKINSVTVVGANGTLGVGISALFASFGASRVYMVCRNEEKAKSAVEKAANAERAYSIKENLIPETYSNIEECIRKSDFVIETIVEDFVEKQKIHKLINEYSSDTTICASVTSGISINELANCYNSNKRKNFLGIHFFNPPYSMLLTELVSSKFTDYTLIKEMHKYLEKKLFRKVIEVKDTPAFLANRIGFYFINRAMQIALKYKHLGGIDYIDSILGLYTGRNLQPLRTADFVRT